VVSINRILKKTLHIQNQNVSGVKVKYIWTELAFLCFFACTRVCVCVYFFMCHSVCVCVYLTNKIKFPYFNLASSISIDSLSTILPQRIINVSFVLIR